MIASLTIAPSCLIPLRLEAGRRGIACLKSRWTGRVPGWGLRATLRRGPSAVHIALPVIWEESAQ